MLLQYVPRLVVPVVADSVASVRPTRLVVPVVADSVASVRPTFGGSSSC